MNGIAGFLASLLVYFQYVDLPPSILGMCSGNNNTSTNHSMITTCTDFELVHLTGPNDTEAIQSMNLRTQDDRVAALGHVEGVKPEEYRLEFSFRNRTHYEGMVEITVNVVEKTDRIVLNRHLKAPDIDYEKIQIQVLCAGGQDEVACIERVVVLNDSFVIKLTKALEANQKYQISIPSFRSTTWNDFAETGSIGLTGSGSDEQGYWGLTTIFQMRYARTVFPCFDHPTMKSKFTVCLQHPSEWTAASNTPLADRSPIDGDAGMVRSCFLQTPLIPTYVFTVALMENYTMINTTMANGGPVIELYAPESKLREMSWIPRSAEKALAKMTSITNFTYPLPKISIYVTYPAPFWGIENFGLVTTEGAFMEQGEFSGKASTILNHEMVHQWLGDVATISDWREICLQEGLTAFLEWTLSRDLQNVPIDGPAAEARGMQRDYLPFLGKYNRTQDIADRCFGFPPLFFKLLSDTYGFEVIERFLNKLLHRKTFQNANVKLWDEILTESTGDEQLNGYLESWFGQSGFAYFFVKQTGREIRITQGRVQDFDHVLVNDETIRPAPLQLLISGGKFQNFTLPRVQNFELKLDSNADWVQLDPDNRVLARKIYDLPTYKKFLSCKNLNSCNEEILTASRRKSIFADFCQGIQLDAFPWGDDQSSFDSDGWIAFFRGLIEAKVINSYCRCCVNSEEENAKHKNCAWQWNHECQRLRINQLLRRNYTMDDESPFAVPDFDDGQEGGQEEGSGEEMEEL